MKAQIDRTGRPSITAREARHLLEKVTDLSGMATVNRSATRQQVYDIFVKYLTKWDDADVIPAHVAKNIQREFGKVPLRSKPGTIDLPC